MTSHDGTRCSERGQTWFGGVVGELAALGRIVAAMPFGGTVAETLAERSFHSVPVVLVHGLFGHPTNFAELRRQLARRGIRRFSSFAYLPRTDYQRLARDLEAHVREVCRVTGSPRADVVGHSLGGLVARYFVQTSGASLVRRLVTLGTPYLAHENPAQELAIFAGSDPLVPPPRDAVRRRALVLGACGHLALLTDTRACAAVARHLLRPEVPVRRSRELAA